MYDKTIMDEKSYLQDKPLLKEVVTRLNGNFLTTALGLGYSTIYLGVRSGYHIYKGVHNGAKVPLAIIQGTPNGITMYQTGVKSKDYENLKSKVKKILDKEELFNLVFDAEINIK